MVVGWGSGKAGVADAATKKKENKNTAQEKTEEKDQLSTLLQVI